MASFFDPSADERRALEQIAAGIPDVQQTFVTKHPQMTMADRGAHQMQLAASTVVVTVASTVPAELDGLGIFAADQRAAPQIGIGRMSTGLGCPHAETEPDFLGLMVAFRTRAGRRIDFITINDPGSPTDTPEEFLALLRATADAAGAASALATQTRLLGGLARHAGLRAPAIAAQVIRQTHRTVRSSTAYQQYWTGVVRARDVLGKFTFVPLDAVSPSAEGHGPQRFTHDWQARQRLNDLRFELRWIPFVNERETPTADLTRAWAHDHEVAIGTVVFPRTDPDTRPAKLVALLAAELGANPGNWQETPDEAGPRLPATRFTAARQLAYRASQAARNVLPEDKYTSFFERGEIASDLATELIRRYQVKRSAGHWVPNLGDLSLT